MNNEIKVVHNHRSSSTSNISLLPDSKTTQSTEFERYQTVKFLITNNTIKSVSINDTVVPSSNIITSLGNKIFNHIPTEFILKTVSTAIANTLSGTMTMYAFNALLASFGFGSGSVNTSRLPSTMSNSERAGHTLITSLKEFLRGLRGGL